MKQINVNHFNHSNSFEIIRVLDARCYAEKTVFPYEEIVLEVFSDSVCELSGGLTLLPETMLCSQLFVEADSSEYLKPKTSNLKPILSVE